MTPLAVPTFDPPPEEMPGESADDPRWTSVFEHWLGTTYAPRLTWPLYDVDAEVPGEDAVFASFVTEWNPGRERLSALTPDQCRQRYEVMLRDRAVTLVAPMARPWFVGDAGRVEEMDALTLLRWIARPARHGIRLLGFERDGRTALLYHHGVDDDGSLHLARLRPSDPPAVDQLAVLGATTARPGGPEALLTQAEAGELLAFAVVPEPDAPDSDSGRDGRPPPRPRPEDLPPDIYASAFIGLADDREGAPLEAVWHINWEAGGTWWLLLHGDRDVEDVSRIPYRQSLSPDDFLRALTSCLAHGATGPALPVYVTHLSGRGHCIYLTDVSEDRVTYLDPWPGRSLLAVGNNDAGITARREDDTGKRWSVTSAELLSVAYAAMVRARTWLEVCGVDGFARYSGVRRGDLFTFFQSRETSRSAEKEWTEITVEPGNWQESIAMTFRVDNLDRLLESRLVVARSWLMDPATRPFAFDLVKSFVHATVVDVDQDEAESLVTALSHVWRGRLDGLESGPPHLLNQTRSVVLAVAGGAPFGRMSLPCTTIRARNLADGAGRREDGDGHDGRDGRDDPSSLELTVTAATTEGGFLMEDLETGYRMDQYRLWLVLTLQRETQRRAARTS